MLLTLRLTTSSNQILSGTATIKSMSKVLVSLAIAIFVGVCVAHEAFDEIKSQLVPSNTLVFTSINNTCPEGFSYLNDQTPLCFRKGSVRSKISRAVVECTIFKSHVCNWQEYSLINHLASEDSLLMTNQLYWTAERAEYSATDAHYVAYSGQNIMTYVPSSSIISFYCCISPVTQ